MEAATGRRREAAVHQGIPVPPVDGKGGSTEGNLTE